MPTPQLIAYPPTKFINVTLTLDAGVAYAAGDVLCDTIELTDVVRWAGGTARLKSIMVHDDDNQGAAINFIFLNAVQSIGTKNAVPDLTDANALKIIAIAPMATTDYIAIAALNKQGFKTFDIPLKAAVGDTCLWLAATTAGTPTHSANGLKVTLGFDQDLE